MTLRRSLLAAVLAAVPTQLAALGPPTSIEWIGAAELVRGATFEGVPVGGLSSIGWDPATGEFLAVSDDRSELGPARVMRLRIGVDVQLWIRTKDGLPERIVLNYATADGRPTFRGEFDDWSLKPKTSEALFVLNAPKGAKELPIAIRPRPGTATVEPEDN